MWFGTLAGLNRYDGYNFKVFRHKINDSTSLSDDFISNIREGPEGKLWIDTRSGQNVFDPQTEKFTVNTATYLHQWSLPDGAVAAIKKDKQGNYWFLQAGNLLTQYNPTTHSSHQVPCTPSGQDDAIADIACDNSGHLWIIHRNGILEQINTLTYAVMDRK